MKLLVHKKIAGFVKPKITKLKSIPQQVWASNSLNVDKLKKFWSSLNFSQRCYLSATVFLLVTQIMTSSGTRSLYAALIIFVVGLVYEFWPQFVKLWDNLAGKALVLFTYAVIANFILASGSTMVNDVTGVAANNLPYSHNFAVILSIPSWFVLTTIFMLAMSQIFTPFYLVILALLKVFGIHGLWHKPDYRFVFTTALVRYILTVILLFNISVLADKLGMIDSFGVEIDDQSIVSLELGEDAQEAILTSINDDNTVTDEDTEAVEPEKSHLFNETQKSMLAWFIYKLEADSDSRCEHPQDTKVVELNDFEILTIKRSEDAQYNYDYSVIPCQSIGLDRFLRSY